MHTRTTIARFLPPIPWWLRGYRICLQCRRLGSDPWWGKIPWRKEWLPTRIFLPKKFYEQRILVSYSPWGHKESDTTDQLTLHFSRRYMCHLAISVKSLMLGELNATVKICLCNTHFTHNFMHNFAIKTNKELEQLIPQRREPAFFASSYIVWQCPEHHLVISLSLTWNWLLFPLIEIACRVTRLRLFVTIGQLMEPWSEALVSPTWGQMSHVCCLAHRQWWFISVQDLKWKKLFTVLTLQSCFRKPYS